MSNTKISDATKTTPLATDMIPLARVGSSAALSTRFQDISVVGTITTGTWSGTTIATSYGGTGVTTSTGSGANVLGTSPTLTTPAISGGTINNSVIGGTTPAAATVMSLTLGGYTNNKKIYQSADNYITILNGNPSSGGTGPASDVTIDAGGNFAIRGNLTVYASGSSIPGYLTTAVAASTYQPLLGYTAAHAGANNDITSLGGLTTALSVAQGGTGVTISSGANSVVLRDASANISTNAAFIGFTNIAAGASIILTTSSTPNYVVTGSGGQTFQLPSALTLPVGAAFTFNNNQSSGAIAVNNNSATLVVSVPSGGYVTVTLLTKSFAAGTWDVHYSAPANVSWSTNTFNVPASITGATWNSTAVGLLYGGTGATTAAGARTNLGLAAVAASGSAIDVSFTQAGTGAVARTVSAELSDTVKPEQFGAAGSGKYVNGNVSITSGTNALTVTGAAFVAGDVGSYIQVPGAGAAGANLFTTIVTRVSATQVTLAANAGTTLEAVAKHVIYGAADDTAAVQAALNTGRYVELTAGRIYLVQNLCFPQASSSYVTDSPRQGIICKGGQAYLTARSGGDSTYLLTTYNWLNNNAFADYPIWLQNVVLDGAGIVQDCQTNLTFQSYYEGVQWINATRNGHYSTTTTKNGTAIANNYQNNQFVNCGATGNGQDGFSCDAARTVTDFQFDGGYWANNGRYGLYTPQMAGFQLSRLHTYSNGTGGLWGGKYGLGTSVVGCYFEDAVTIDSMVSTIYCGVLGPGNTFGGRVAANFSDNTAYEALLSTGNFYTATGYLYQGYNGPQHILISSNDISASGLFQWNGNASSTGKIFANNCYGRGPGFNAGSGAFWDGLMIPATVNTPGKVELLKTLNNAGTTSTAVLVATVANFAMAGFVASGTLDVWSTNSGSTAIESYTADVEIQYYRGQSNGLHASKAVIKNASSTAGSPTVSAAISISDTVVSGGNNTVTVTITITHPQAPDANYSSGFDLKLNSRNRSVTALTLT